MHLPMQALRGGGNSRGARRSPPPQPMTQLRAHKDAFHPAH